MSQNLDDIKRNKGYYPWVEGETLLGGQVKVGNVTMGVSYALGR